MGLEASGFSGFVMGCLCSRTAEVWDGHIPIAPGVTCEQAREFLQGPMNWAAIQNQPESTVTKHADGSWDSCFPSGDVFKVYDQAVTGTVEAGDLALSYRGNLKISPGSMDFGQTYEFIKGAGGSGITIRRHVYDLKVDGCISCVMGCCMGTMMVDSLKKENASIAKLLEEQVVGTV